MRTRLSAASHSSITEPQMFVIIFYYGYYLILLTGLSIASSAVWPANRNDLQNNLTSFIVNNSDHTKLSEHFLNSCPNCLSVAENKPLAERLKVEAIKKQILSKLNLPERPNITATIPRELILEALRKAQLDTNSNSNNNGNNYQSFASQLYSVSGSYEQLPQSDQQSTSQRGIHSTPPHHPSTPYQDNSNYISSSSDDYYGKPSEIIAFAEPGSKVNGHTLVVFIPPHDNIHRLEVTSATLWVQIRLRHLNRNLHYLLRDHFITLYIFRVVETRNSSATTASTSSTVGSNLELITSHKIRASRPGWKHIEFRDAIQKWFSTAMSSASKLTLLVDCVGCDSIIDIVLFDNVKQSQTTTHATTPDARESSEQPQPHHHSHSNSNSNNNYKLAHSVSKPTIRHNSNNIKNGYRPFVVITTQTKISRRSRRHTLTCDSKTNQCCKQSLYVSFKELSWDDWIIAPKGYFANYCVGDCSKRRTPDTYVYFHSHVIEEYRNKNPYASITPCCAPTKLSAISLIYFDPELNIIKADLPKMVVEECGCT